MRRFGATGFELYTSLALLFSCAATSGTNKEYFLGQSKGLATTIKRDVSGHGRESLSILGWKRLATVFTIPEGNPACLTIHHRELSIDFVVITESFQLL